MLQVDSFSQSRLLLAPQLSFIRDLWLLPPWHRPLSDYHCLLGGPLFGSYHLSRSPPAFWVRSPLRQPQTDSFLHGPHQSSKNTTFPYHHWKWSLSYPSPPYSVIRHSGVATAAAFMLPSLWGSDPSPYVSKLWPEGRGWGRGRLCLWDTGCLRWDIPLKPCCCVCWSTSNNLFSKKFSPHLFQPN